MVNYSDLRCGKIICTYEGTTILTIPNATITYSNINGKICVTVDYPYNDRNSEKMWVKDGTVCGENKVCRFVLPRNFLI